MAVFSPLALPFGPVPITLQTLAVGIVASLLRPREAFLSILVYLLLGGVGLPVFSAGGSGFGVLFGPTGGFLLAFLPVGLLMSLVLTRYQHKPWLSFLINLLGFALILLIGSFWFKTYNHASWQSAFELAFLPFVPIELLKAVVSSIVSLSLLPILRRSQPYFTN
ncbi:biotin transporter BioY [Lactococcus termiticola]|uniref:biotin transporter BioY n=1 Tax=Lactococcus termiticola TaxID=2169526 RepID=UPI001CED469E|nr:biotin transporter BioY [Lactococcus termiticola]